MANALGSKQSRFLFTSLLPHLDTSWPMRLLLLYRSLYPDRLIQRLLTNGYQKLQKAFLFFSLAFLFIFFFFLLNVCQARYYDWSDISGDYNEKVSAAGGTLELIDYVKILSIRDPLDSLEKLEYKRSAIGYLLATGGPSGFRVEPATPEEREVLLNSLCFAAILHENLGYDADPFDLMANRQSAHCITPTEIEKEHLRIAQTTFSATRALVKAGKMSPIDTFVAAIKKVYQRDCQTTLNLVFPSNRERQLQTFTQAFTKELASRTKDVFESIEGVSTSSLQSLPLVYYSEDFLQDYIGKVCCESPASSATNHHKLAHDQLKMTLKNGMTVLRELDGTVSLTSSDRGAHLGRLHLQPFSTYVAPIFCQLEAHGISKYQNEDDFLNSLDAVYGILDIEGRSKKSVKGGDKKTKSSAASASGLTSDKEEKQWEKRRTWD